MKITMRVQNRFLFSTTVTVLLSSPFALAETAIIDGIPLYYTATNGEAIVGYIDTPLPAVSSGTTGAIAIPPVLDGYPVTSIGDYAFYGCSKLTSITIPNSVTNIGGNAFDGCSGLTSITIPDGISCIGIRAFAQCSELTSIVVPNSVTEIGSAAFAYCYRLKEILLPDGLEMIDDYMFYDCHSLDTVIIPCSVKSIGEQAFDECWSLKSFRLSDNVKHIGSTVAFMNVKMANVIIDITDLTGWATNRINGWLVGNMTKHLYYNGEEITDFVIPDGVQNIGESAFADCSGLTSVRFPHSVTNIGCHAFDGCSELMTLTIPSGVVSIESFAFSKCTNLTWVTISDSVTSIDSCAFYDCSELNSVLIGCGFADVNDSQYKPFSSCKKIETIFLPESYSSIEDYWIPYKALIVRYGNHVTFDASPGTLPANTRTVFAITNSHYGASCEFPDSPTRPGYSFGGWSFGETIITPESEVQTSRNHVLNAAWIPNDYAVSLDATGGAVDFAAISVVFGSPYGELPSPRRSPYVFFDWVANGTHVDANSIVATPSDHTLTARWGIEIGNGIWGESICDGPIVLGEPLVAPTGAVEIPAEIAGRPVVVIGANAFAGNTAITSISIPASVTNIAEGAFEGCTGIKTVYFNGEGDVKYPLAEYLSGAEASVERVVFLDGVTAIPDNFCEGCTALRTMDIAESVVDIGTNVFEACSALETAVTNGLALYQGWVLGYADAAAADSRPPDLVIPEGVRGIAAGAFEGEFGIGTLTLPESLRFVGTRAFKDCTALESIAIPEGVAKIDREAFRNCTWAQGLALPGTLREIGDGAFANGSTLLGAELPEGVVSVGECAFSNCWRMLSVSIPQSVERIGDGAFADCRRLTGVTVPLHVRTMAELFPAAYSNLATVAVASPDGSLGVLAPRETEAWLASRQMVPGVFKGCTALEGIELPEWVRNVSDGALEGCKSIAALKLPEAVTNVGARACASMAALESVEFPASLVSVGDEAFDGDAAVASFVLPEGLRSIGERAFRGLALLARAAVPGSVRTIGDGAFAECASVRAVSMPGDAGTVVAVFPDAYLDIVSATIVAEDGGRVVDASLPTLMERLFEGCTALTRIEMPQNLAEIGASAFADCAALAEIGIPAAVTNLGAEAFSGCTTLSSVALPKNLQELRDGTFAGCASMAEIVVPESVRRFGNGIFDGCTLLRSVRFVGNAPDYATADGGPYAGVPAGAKSYVANGSKGWDGIATSMALPEYWPARTTYEIAFWTPNRYAVSFDPNFGDETPAEVEQVTGTSYVLPPNPVRLGARFDGWWTERENGARVTASTQVTATRPHAFFAHWTMNRYFVHLDASGGTGTADPVEMTVGTPTALPPCPFAKVGNAFAGWATEPGGGVVYADGAEVSDLAYAQNAAVTLYAVWRARDWTLADYLDAPGLGFEMAGGGEWGPDWVDAKSGGVSLRCVGLPPSATGGTAEATLRTSVTGAGTLAFWWKVACEENDEDYGEWYDFATFAVDGDEIARIAGESGWRKIECSVSGAGTHTIEWAFIRDDYDEEGADWENALWVDAVEWTPAAVTVTFDAGGAAEGTPPSAVVKYAGYSLVLPGPGTLANPLRVFAGWTDGETVYAPGATYIFGSEDTVLTAVWALHAWTLAEAVDAPVLTFATGGDADWTVDTTVGWTNGVSAKSGAVASGKSAWIETTVSGDGLFSFRWKVEGGVHRDVPFAYAMVEVDGAPTASAHLTDGWDEQVLDIVGTGLHMIRWTYLRTSSRMVEGGDCAWLDGVAWKPSEEPADFAILTEDLPPATDHEQYRAQLEASGGTGRLTWRIVAGRLPDGVILQSVGSLWAWRVTPGIYSFTIEARDEAGHSATRSFTMAVPKTETHDSPISVPLEWLDRFGLASDGDYEQAAVAMSANGVQTVGECYLAGLDPTNVESRLEVRMRVENGNPVITWEPDLSGTATWEFSRLYTVQGKERLSDPDWGQTNAATRFFRVKVRPGYNPTPTGLL